MDAVMDCEAPGAFYRVEGGETVLWRRNDRQRVEFFNASISGRREEGAAPCFERGKEHAWWLLVPVWRDDQRMQQCGGGRHLV
jgi:hypothetical protein